MAKMDKNQNMQEATSKDQSEMDAKILIKREIRKTEKFIKDCDIKIGKDIDKARDAKKEGKVALYKLHVSNIKKNEYEKVKSESFILRTNTLLEISSVDKSMNSIYQSMINIASALGDLGVSAEGVLQTEALAGEIEEKFINQTQEIDDILDTSNEVYIDGAYAVNPKIIDKRINGIMAEIDSDDEMDAATNDEIKKIKDSLIKD